MNNGGKNKVVIIIIILVIICCACGVGYFILNKKTVNTEKEKTNSTVISTEVNDEPTDEDEILEDDGIKQKELLTKKDSDYVYTYYYNKDNDFDNEIVSFKIKDKDVIDDIGFVSEISEIKKYKDFIAIKADYIASCGPDHNDLFIFDYEGNLLFKSGNISVKDLSKWKNSDSDEKWNTGQMQLYSYKYNESDKILEVIYSFNINSVIGDCSNDGGKEFCNAAKNGTIYDGVVITTKLIDGKFVDETISSKNTFNIENYNEDDKELYKESCK